jgi:two-component system cell cycle response regulator
MSKPKVLIVDDSLLILKLCRAFLGDAYEISTAQTGREALAKARAEQPDLLLTDQNLPDLFGHEIVAVLARDPRTRRMPAVIVTTPGEIRALRGRGLSTFEKPFDRASLLHRVSEALLQATRVPLAWSSLRQRGGGFASAHAEALS